MNRPVRIASIEAVIPTYRYAFLEHLARRHEVEVTCFHGVGKTGYSVTADERPLSVDSRRITNFHWPFGGARVAWQTGLWTIVTGRFDAVICAEATHNLTTWLILLLRPIGGYSVILSGHGLRPLLNTGWRESLRLGLRRALARLADTMMVYSERSARDTIALGISADKVFVARNTLDTRRLIAIAGQTTGEFGRQSAGLAETQMPFRDQPFTLLFLGRLYPAKRIDLLIGSVSTLQSRGRAVRAIIIGDGHLRNELEDMARPFGNIQFTGAEYDDYRLTEYFAGSDILVLPDAVGLGVVHAFCNGTPILTARNGKGHGPEIDYVREGYNGCYAEELAAPAFADQIERLIDHPAEMDILRAGALATARTISLDRMVDGYIDAARHAAARHGKSRVTQ